MNHAEFSAWAAGQGLNNEAIEQLLQYAATLEDMKAAFDAIEPAPPIDTLQDTQEMTDEDPYGVSPANHGFVLIGGCPNGDPIAVDVADDKGSIWYINHESMHDTPLREAAFRVASDVESFVQGMDTDDDFPFDYYDAKQQQVS